MRPWRVRPRKLAVTLVVGLIAGVGPFLAGETLAAPTLELEGRGWGHGRGLGQYGALGYAVDHGWDHARILDHFYGGTRAANIGNRPMSVRLTRFDGVDTLVEQERGHLTTTAAAGTFTALRAVRLGSNLFRVDSAPSCGGPWSVLNPGLQGPVYFDPVHKNEDRMEMIQACEPSGARRWLRGSLAAVDDSGTHRTINHLGTEEYLRGVVPRESPASWGDLGGGAGINALRSQAVAARSYASAENRYPYAQTCDTTACQVYGGRAVQEGTFRDLEDPRTDRAISETWGLVRELNGGPARTEFSSSTGGWTAGGTFPAVLDDGDDIGLNSNQYWTTSIPSTAIEAAWPSIGRFISLEVVTRNGYGSWGGRALEVLIRGTLGNVTTTGNGVRSRLGLKSDWFNVRGMAGQPGWESLGGILESGPDGASWGPGRLDVFIRGKDQTMWHKWWQGTWQEWESLGGVVHGDPSAVAWGPNRIDTFVRSSDGALWHKWFDGSWHEWESLGGSLTSAPDASSWGPGRLDIFAKGTDSALWHRWYDGVAWRDWESLGGVLTEDPAVVSWGPGRIDVFVRSSDNALWHKWYDGIAWRDWESLGGSLTSGPDVSSWASGRLDVVARGGDSAIWHKWFDGTWHEWQSLGGTLADDPSAVSWGTNRLDLFAKGPDSAMWHKWFDGRWSG